MAFAPYCSLPELEACMKVWEFMEMIHSRSYTYIIKNVYSNPSDIFDTILEDPKILEVTSVTESYDDFIQNAAMYASGNEWQHVLDEVQPHSTTFMNSRENLPGSCQRQYPGRN